MNSTRSADAKVSKSEWFLVTVLVVSVFINYIDRGNLSMAAPLIEKELALSPLQIGSLLSAFFWTYALMQLFGISGWIVDRYSVGLVFACGFLAWSTATIATGFVSGFPLLYTARLVLGAGESIAYPCYSRIFADLPQHHRGRANALLDAGTKLGPAVGAFLGGILLARFGWRTFFVALGVGSLLWLIPWLRFVQRDFAARIDQSEALPSMLELLTLRSAWGTFLGHFCGNYFFYFLLTWIPIYLVKERHFSIREMGNFTSVLFLVVAAATVGAGWISDRLIAGGAPPTAVRKTIVGSGLASAAIVLPVAFVQNLTASLALLLLACIGYGIYASNHWAISQTLAGPSMAGRWTSVQNGIGNLSGIAGPWLAGLIVQRTGSSKLAFIVSAAIALTGALLWTLLIGPVEQVRWSVHRSLAHR